MKNLILTLLSGFILTACSHNTDRSGNDAPAIPVDNDIEKRVREIVGKMSIEDKIGQMCEVEIAQVCADSLVNGQIELDAAKLAIQQARKDARQQIRQEVSEFAIHIAEKVLRGEMNDQKAQAKLVNNLLDEIENQN